MMLKILLIAVLALIGLFIGFILSRLAKDEIRPGKKYLSLLQAVTSMAIVIGIALEVSQSLSSYLIGSFIAGLVVSLFLRIKYLALGIAVFASASIQSQLFLFICLAAFLYGLPAGSLIYKRISRELWIRSALFLVPAVILLFDASQYADYLLAFAAGSLLGKK